MSLPDLSPWSTPPVPHAPLHATGGSDVITPAMIGAAAAGDAPLAHAATHARGAADALTLTQLGDPLDASRSAEVATMHRLLAAAAVTLASGTPVGMLATVRTPGIYTKIRCSTRTGSWVSATNARMGVYSLDGNTRRAETANFSGLLVASAVIEQTLNPALNLAAGEQVLLALGAIATSMGTFSGIAAAAGFNVISTLAPGLGRTASGWAGAGSLPTTLPTNAVGIALPWLELLP